MLLYKALVIVFERVSVALGGSALLNDFRHFDYATEYKYPTVVLDQMKGLLAKYENLYNVKQI
jgi:hypothetical protein